MPCRSGCPTPGRHESWGACARSARIQIDQYALKHSIEEKAKVTELSFYDSVRHDGILPDTTRTKDIQFAVDMTKKSGEAYRADKPDKGLTVERRWEFA